MEYPFRIRLDRVSNPLDLKSKLGKRTLPDIELKTQKKPDRRIIKDKLASQRYETMIEDMNPVFAMRFRLYILNVYNKGGSEAVHQIINKIWVNGYYRTVIDSSGSSKGGIDDLSRPE